MNDGEERNNKGPGEDESVPTASFSGSEDGPGGQIGPYKLLSILGEGGFGIVYLAERQRPVRRRVALKVIKPGMDSKQVIARFETERQALALLDHPNIAHVFSAGTTKAGRPYFVMECVKGVPLTEYCDREKLNIEERLELFQQVCDAVQHAHQKGIIHRDIKPSNMLVSIQDNKAVPKIIDFGVAKAISQPLTERTLFTEQGQLIGTPEYMSPEQAEMTAEDIDTRSDIYSLGVMLYELLTGVLPFEAETLREGGFEHIRHVIREEEPKTPSTRLSRLGDEESTRLARSRRIDIGTLRRKLHGDLDWITLKAMEKDRTRRYVSAAELAADIKHHLNHEPVLASPPSTVYRMKKFVRRNRASVTAAAVIAAAIIIGFVISSAMYFRAESLRVQAEQAREKEVTARTEAEQAREKEAAARVQAEQAENIAQQQRQRAVRLLATSQIEHGVKLLNEGNHLGLLDLLEARMTADKIPDLRDSAGRLWAIAHNLRSGRVVHVLPGTELLAFSPDGGLLATAGGTTAQLWDTATGQPRGPELQLEKNISAVVFSPDGKLLATHSVEGVSQLWDTATGEPVGPILQHDGGTLEQLWESLRWSAAFSPDGKLLATASLDGTVRLWETNTGEAYGEPLRHEGEVWAVAFSPDGKLLANGSLNGTAQLWEVASGEPHGPPLQHRGRVDKVAFSADGKLVATMSADGTAGLWETDTGQLHKRLQHLGLLDAVFSPNGKLLATGSRDGTAKLWDGETGQQLAPLLRHATPVRAVAYSPDGNLLATVSGDEGRTVRLWDVTTGPPYHGLAMPAQAIGGKAALSSFSSNGTLLVSRSGDGGALVWRLPMAPAYLRGMQLRTWLALGAQRDDGGEVTAIPWGQLQKLRDELHFFEVREPQASWPQPADGGDLSVRPDAKLRWIPGLDASAHNVYFGTGPNELKLLGQVKDTWYANLPPLERRRWYCWRVDTVKSDGSVIKGNLWSFSMGKMVGWWKFEEGSGSTATNSGTFGSSHEGTLNNMDNSNWVGGVIGGALEFDGVDDYVSIPALNLNSNTLTITAWIKRSGSQNWWTGLVYCTRNDGSTWEGSMCIAGLSLGDSYWQPSSVDHLAYHWDTDVGWQWRSGLFVPDSEWTFAAVVVEPAQATLYIMPAGGELYSDINYQDHIATTFDQRWTIGKDERGDWGGNRCFKGQIDDVRIYSCALSQAEVAAIYSGEEPGPIAKPKWVLEVSREEYAPPEPKAEKGVPIGLKPARDEEEQRLVETLEAQRRALGEEHPKTLFSMHSLGVLYGYQGRYDEAEPLFVNTLEIRRRVLGEEHPETLVSMTWLAWLYLQQGRYEEAEPLLYRPLEIRRRVLGEEHRDTLWSMVDLGELYLVQGRYDEAEPLLVKALEGRRRVLGEEYPDTLDSMNYLAWLYYKWGRYEEAEPLFVKTLEIRRRVLGEEHTDTLTSINNLAALYYKQGRYDEAEPLLVKVLEGRRRVLDEEDALALNALSWFQATCPVAKVRDGAKAVEYATKACELTSWENASYIDTLAAAYAEAGDFDSAVKWQKEALDLLHEVIPAETRAGRESRLKLYESGKPYREP